MKRRAKPPKPPKPRGAGSQWVEGANWKLAEEVRYIQGRAAKHDSRIVTAGQLMLFSTESGDAWMLDPSDKLATPLARDGEPLSVHIEETASNFTIDWQGEYRIEGETFVYLEKGLGRMRGIFGYPTRLISEQSEKIATMFGNL
jgi:hypothetical protein